jgi:polyphenol oxidase
LSDDVIDSFVAGRGIGGDVAAFPLYPRGLPASVLHQLRRIGMHAVAGRTECTMCHARADGRFSFHSYRRDRATRTPVVDVQWSAIAIQTA